jgi:hypothetical protein
MLDQPGVTGSIERYGETVLTAVGTSLGWTRTTP